MQNIENSPSGGSWVLSCTLLGNRYSTSVTELLNNCLHLMSFYFASRFISPSFLHLFITWKKNVRDPNSKVRLSLQLAFLENSDSLTPILINGRGSSSPPVLRTMLLLYSMGSSPWEFFIWITYHSPSIPLTVDQHIPIRCPPTSATFWFFLWNNCFCSSPQLLSYIGFS